MQLYFDTLKQERSEKPSKRLRDLVVLMRSLIVSPDILQPNFDKNTMYTMSASAFYEAYLKYAEKNENRFFLLRQVFVHFEKVVPECPPEYATIPQNFIRSLSTIMYKDKKVISDFFTKNLESIQRIVQGHEVYADFCKVSPLLAMQLAEVYPLWPNQQSFNALGLEKTPFIAQFFVFRTVSSPLWVNDQLVFAQSTLTDEEMSDLVNCLRRSMDRIHTAQHTILLTFLTASYVSRDYILSYVATLAEANVSRRANPAGQVSNDGVLMNLSMTLLEVLRTTLLSGPTEQFAQQFFLYLFSDLGRVDFLKRDFPADLTLRTHLFNLLNWLRPENSLARHCDSREWWRVLRSNTTELSEMLDSGLECKPHASFSQFVKAMYAPTDSLTFSPTMITLKSYFDYSYNYFITGIQPSRVMPSYFQTVTCSGCKKSITKPPCYRCICCTSYFLCEDCYQQEVSEVCAAFCPPFSSTVRTLLLSSEEVSRIDTSHNPYTHLFTELRRSSVIVSNRPVFQLTPSFSPQLPNVYEAVKKNANLEESEETRDKLVALYKGIGDVLEDEAYEYWNGNTDAILKKYGDTICLCATPSHCRCHGPVTQAIRRVSRPTPIPVEKVIGSGFTMHYQCYYCKTTPIIGTVYYCLHCALRLCKLCYERDMKTGNGFPGHQCNHVFILIYHPVREDCLLDHNRNDMRTVPNTVTTIPNSLAVSGVALDAFMPTRDEEHKNDGNLAVEVFMLALRLMMVGQIGFFQEYDMFSQLQRLAKVKQLRSIQLNVGNCMEYYLGLSEHVAYSLLLLFTFHTPRNHPLPRELNLHGDITDHVVKVKIPSRRGNMSRLWELVIENVDVSPLFQVLASSMLDVVSHTIEYYMRQSSVFQVKSDMRDGKLDYSLLLLLLCCNEHIVSNVILRFDIIQTLFVMCTVSREKDETMFLFEYPPIRHGLMMFTQRAFIDSASFRDIARASLLQLHVNKIMILLLRSSTVRV